MSLAMQHMPSLGYFNKVICDSLGLWSSNIKDIQFNVPATEKERRAALIEAFNAIKKDDGSYGSLNDLISHNTSKHPKDKEIIRKNKTIQDYTNHLSKDDFLSHEEFKEFQHQIRFIISDKYQVDEISNFASEFYLASINHYRQFIREHSIKKTASTAAYVYFIKNILSELLNNMATESANIDISSIAISNEWPLKSFIDYVAKICDVSIYRLNQFHEVKLNNHTIPDQECWNPALSAEQNTRSKQFIQRLTKHTKIKWDKYYNQIKPFICLLPESMSKDMFSIIAFYAFILHNLNIHINETAKHDKSVVLQLGLDITTQNEYGLSSETVSDKLDRLINGTDIHDEPTIIKAVVTNEDFVSKLRCLSSSNISSSIFPSTLNFTYNKLYFNFNIEQLLANFADEPEWIYLWKMARYQKSIGKPIEALEHYKNAFNKAKYVSGSLFILLYIDVCSFCKSQYKAMKNNNEEDLFDRIYEGLGAGVSKYAMLLGYFPATIRDAKTLIPSTAHPIKSRILLDMIDYSASLQNP